MSTNNNTETYNFLPTVVLGRANFPPNEHDASKSHEPNLHLCRSIATFTCRRGYTAISVHSQTAPHSQSNRKSPKLFLLQSSHFFRSFRTAETRCWDFCQVSHPKREKITARTRWRLQSTQVTNLGKVGVLSTKRDRVVFQKPHGLQAYNSKGKWEHQTWTRNSRRRTSHFVCR